MGYILQNTSKYKYKYIIRHGPHPESSSHHLWRVVTACVVYCLLWHIYYHIYIYIIFNT